MDFPGGSDSKASACNVGDLGSIPGSGRSPGEGNGNPLQCSCLENPRGRGACWAAVYGVTQSRRQLKQLSSSSNSRGRKKTQFSLLPKDGGNYRRPERDRVSGQPKHRCCPMRGWVLNSEFPVLSLHAGLLRGLFFSEVRIALHDSTRQMFDVCRYVDRRITIKPVD